MLQNGTFKVEFDVTNNCFGRSIWICCLQNSMYLCVCLVFGFVCVLFAFVSVLFSVFYSARDGPIGPCRGPPTQNFQLL